MKDQLIYAKSFEILGQKLEPIIASYAQIVILCDENTAENCLPHIQANSALRDSSIYTVKEGEWSKSLSVYSEVMEFLKNQRINRNAIILNLGGGVVCDLGGFVASTWKRGVDYLHIPTTLMAMCDAAIGGKNGVNFKHLKNQIGTFNIPKAVVICPEFLSTLPQPEILSGFAEIIKHSLIGDSDAFEKIEKFGTVNASDLSRIIQDSAKFKSDVVFKDPLENGIRKTLNFGHTLGHALESHCIENNHSITHGAAVAEGMIFATQISSRLVALSANETTRICNTIRKHFPPPGLALDLDALVHHMQHDKKNSDDQFSFILLEKIGKAVYDVPVSEDILRIELQSHFN